MTTMTKEKSNNQSLKAVLGAEAYLEYKSDNDAIISRQTKIADKQVEIITQRVEDKFERRLIEEISNLDKRIMDKFDSQLKWIISTMIGLAFTMATLIMGMIYFLHK